MITILSNPSGEPSAQDGLWHVFNSDNSGVTDFRYVVDIYYNGSQQIRSKIFADPTTGKGYFDAAPIVRNGFSVEWFTPTNNTDKVYLVSPNDSGQISLGYQIRIGEDVSGVTTTNMASGMVTAYNWLPPIFKRKTFDSTLITDGYFTNRPLTARNILGQKFLIGYRSDQTLTLEVKTYDMSNTLVNTYTDINTHASGYVQVDIGRDTINDKLGPEIINENVKYYDVFFTDKAFRIYNTCSPQYTTYNLYFLNAWGMFDTAQFSLVSRLTKDIERKSFAKPDYRQGAGVTYYDSNNVYHESKINYNNKSTPFMRLTMDAPTDEEWVWLGELVESPLIYMERHGYYYPVTIKNTNYEYSEHKFNGLKPFEIDIDVNQVRHSQLR